MGRNRNLDWIVLGALVVAWGSAFAGLKIAVEVIPPVWTSVMRLWVATFTLWLIAAARGEQLPPITLGRASPWGWYALLGLVGMAVPFMLFATAAASLPSAVNAICNGASPVFTVALAHLFLGDERLDPRRAAGVALGFVGLVVLVGPRLAGGGVLGAGALMLSITAAFLYAASNVITRKAPQVGALSGAVFATFGALVLHGPPPVPPLKGIAAVTALGVVSTGLGTIGYVWLIQRRGPVFTSMAIYLVPLWATVLGVGLMGERPGWSAFAALALILAGVGLTTAPRRRKAQE
jgi:drug/metabolite transporter (DMT)-like permease